MLEFGLNKGLLVVFLILAYKTEKCISINNVTATERNLLEIMDNEEMRVFNKTESSLNNCTYFGCAIGLASLGFDEPSAAAKINVQFWLYTKFNQTHPHIVNYRYLSAVFDTEFNSSNPTKFIVHGFNNNCQSPTILAIKDGLFFVNEDFNVFCVDWENGAKTIYYPQAARNSKIVTLTIISFLKLLKDRFGDMNDKLHFIGYSLGAHISGSVGRHEKNISRISGLDPAGLMFNHLKNKLKLDPSDALFVDVIHSDGGSVKGLGTINAMGNLDFYPNGGKSQPGCLGLAKEVFRLMKGDILQISCRHRRGPMLFAASMSPGCKFIGFNCSSYENFMKGECYAPNNTGIEMGYFAKKPTHNYPNLYFLTRGTWPYCGHQFLVTLEFKTSNGQHYWNAKSITLFFSGSDDKEESFLLTEDILPHGLVKLPVIVDPSIRNWHLEMLYADKRKLFFKLKSISVVHLSITNVYGTTTEWRTDNSTLISNIKTVFHEA